MWDILRGLGTICSQHQTPVTISRELLASALTGPTAAADASVTLWTLRHAPESLSAPPHAAPCRASGSPASGAGPAVSLAPTSAPTCAATAAGWRTGAWPWHRALHNTGRTNKAACPPSSEAEGPSPLLSYVLSIVRMHEPSQPRLSAGELCRTQCRARRARCPLRTGITYMPLFVSKKGRNRSRRGGCLGLSAICWHSLAGVVLTRTHSTTLFLSSASYDVLYLLA